MHCTQWTITFHFVDRKHPGIQCRLLLDLDCRQSQLAHSHKHHIGDFCLDQEQAVQILSSLFLD